MPTFVNGAHALQSVSVPLVLGGGIGTGRQIAAALALGADGVVMGSRFMVAAETAAHDALKRRIIASGVTGSITIMDSLSDTGGSSTTPRPAKSAASKQAACAAMPISATIPSSRTREKVVPRWRRGGRHRFAGSGRRFCRRHSSGGMDRGAADRRRGGSHPIAWAAPRCVALGA